MGSLNLDCALAKLLTRAAFGVAFAPRHPFIELAVNRAGHDLAIGLFNFTTFTISTAMILLSLDATLTLSLARPAGLGALTPSLPGSPFAINGAGVYVAFCELHQGSITDLAVI
jgi:hypothetical protein